MDLRLPDKNTATRNSIEVALKALVGFVAGLALVVWGVPGVKEAVFNYILTNWVNVALTIGVPSGVTGLINFYFDWKKKDLPNY